MFKVFGCITQQHDLRLVVTAGVICFLACFTAVNMLWRSSAHRGVAQTGWLAGAAFVFGTGVWTTHFIAMLAYRSDLLMGYSALETVSSLVIPCIGAWAMFWVSSHGSSGLAQRCLSGMLLGAAVGAMHFAGAFGMRFRGTVVFDPMDVGAAIAIGMLLCAAAMTAGGRLEDTLHRMTATVLLAGGIVSLHFTGMSAISVIPGVVGPDDGLVFGTPLLATIVIAATTVILILSLFSSFVDQHLAWRTLQEEGSLRHIAHHDILTGLPNRLALGPALEGILRSADRQSTSCAVLCLDVDRFKLVNDLYGHQAGDDVLKRFASRVEALTRPVDLVARISGDEFVVAMAPSADPDAANILAARLVAALAEPIIREDQHISVGASIGIALYPQDGSTPGELLRNADMALYQAKRDGRGTHRFFEPTMNERLRTRQNLEQDLRRGIEASEFKLYYQPLLQTESQRVIGYEALIRWDHPTRGLVPPMEFIPIAEESGMIVPLGRWVLETACQEASLWPDDLQVSVNVSPVQFQQPDLGDMVVEILARTGFPPHRLELEMTESVLIQHAEQALATLEKLRDYGVRLSLDDFGTGYSSLSYLRRYPFNKIKIDRSFIQALGDGSGAGVLARAIVALGHSLGMEVTAEGVETVEQYRFLEQEACNQVQGYLFGKPVPARKQAMRNRLYGWRGPETCRSMSSRRRSFRGRYLRQQQGQRRGHHEGERDGAERIGISHGRSFPIGNRP
jgi:diguanylate cyclase (GGDEF)-like protein